MSLTWILSIREINFPRKIDGDEFQEFEVIEYDRVWDKDASSSCENDTWKGIDIERPVRWHDTKLFEIVVDPSSANVVD